MRMLMMRIVRAATRESVRVTPANMGPRAGGVNGKPRL
jgi:hypothetical protein